MAGKKGRSGGHNRKTPGLHLVAGTHRKDRHGPIADARAEISANKSEPIPTAPGWLSPSARQEWRRVAKRLHARGDLSSIDRMALTTYCQSYSEYRDAETGRLTTLKLAKARLLLDPNDHEAAQIVAYGATLIPTAESGWIRNPAVVVANAAANRMNAAGREFGMAPVSRARKGAAGGGSTRTAEADFPEELADDAAGA